MPSTIKFEVRGAACDEKEIEGLLREEIEKTAEVRVQSVSGEIAHGLTSEEIAITFVASALGSAIGPVLRDHIGAAVAAVAAATGTRLRVILPPAETEQEEEIADDSDELAKMRDAYMARHFRNP
jgi:hypothetical protein